MKPSLDNLRTQRKRRLLWHILIASGLTFLLLYLPILILNNPLFQQWFLKTYRPFTPWKVELNSLVFQPFPPKIKLNEVTLVHPEGHQLKFKTLKLKIKLWRLLRGQLAVTPLKIDDLTVSVAKKLQVAKKRERKRFKWRTLLLLQNLLLKEGEINQVRVALPNHKQITIAKIEIGLEPALLGGTKLDLAIEQLGVGQGETTNPQIKKIFFQVTTDFNHWYKTFPYVNDLAGNLEWSQAIFGNFPIEKLEAKLTYKNFRLRSEKFLLQIGKNELLGELESRLRKQTFNLKFHTPQSITLPEFDTPTRVFNTAGDLKLNLQIEGKGFNLQKTRGKGIIKLTHLFASSKDHPVDLSLDLAWNKGVVQIEPGTVAVDGAKVAAQGTFQMKPAHFDLKFHSEGFPLERFFEKFEDTNLHPIHGKGAFQGTFEGFGKNIHLALTGEASEGGYGPLLAQKAKVELDITYQRLHLLGSLFSETKETGLADLTIDYGPKTPGSPRPKTIQLKAEFKQHPLEAMLSQKTFRGEVDAKIQLSGKNQEFRGEGELSAEQGEVLGIAFESISAPFQLTTLRQAQGTAKELVIQKAHLVLPYQTIDLENPILLNFIPQGLNITGKPLPGLNLELNFSNQTRTWQIKRFNYKNPEAPEFWATFSGTFHPNQLALKGKGHLDLASLMFLSHWIREGQGPFTFELQTSGPPTQPNVQGKVLLENNLLSLRVYPLIVEELQGTIVFKDNRVETEKLAGLLGVGHFELSGSLTHENWQPKFYDLSLKGRQLYFRNQPGFFRMEYDANLILKGPQDNALLKGKLTILDGRYTKDFNIIEEIKSSQKPLQEIQTAVHKGHPILLDIQVRNLGDWTIDNNVGRIELAANLQVRGKTFAPQVEGSIEVTEGQIYYLGLDFEITHGFMEFRDPDRHPYLEVEAEQEIADAHLVARLHGRTNNLTMDLEGNSATLGPLERKDVISLILFGMTTSERHQQSQYQQLELGPELVAEQITHALQRPFARLTKLDLFRLETQPSEEGRIRRFHLGKRITDRLHVEFASEIDREDALQTFSLEYWLTDFLIFKGSRRSEEGYQLNAGFRLTSQ